MVSRPLRQLGMRDVLQGERLASRRMRVKALQVADDLAASHSGYIPESGTRAQGNDQDPRQPSGAGKGTDALAALLLFPPAPAAGAGAALGAVLLLTGLCVE